MKSKIIIKSHPTIQLAHLYEHLFTTRVKEYFFENKLTKGLDYALRGATYDKGCIIEIECEFYSDQAKKLSDKIDTLTIECTDNDVNKALYQIMAEEEYAPFVTDKKRLTDELMSLNNKPWQDIDTLDSIDTKKMRRRNNLIGLSGDVHQKPRILRSTLVLDPSFAKSHRELAPLFSQLGRWLLLTVADTIAYKRAYYVGEFYGRPEPLSVISELLVAPPLAATMDMDHILVVISDTINDMCTSSNLERFCNSLSGISYSHGLYESPDQIRNLNYSDFYVGPRGWQKIATPENIALITENITIELKFGRRKMSKNPHLS